LYWKGWPNPLQRIRQAVLEVELQEAP